MYHFNDTPEEDFQTLIAPGSPSAQSAAMLGSPGTFDVANFEGRDAHGFEVQIEGIQPRRLVAGMVWQQVRLPGDCPLHYPRPPPFHMRRTPRSTWMKVFKTDLNREVALDITQVETGWVLLQPAPPPALSVTTVAVVIAPESGRRERRRTWLGPR